MRQHRTWQLAQRVADAIDHAVGKEVGLGRWDMSKAEARAGGELRLLPAGGIGGQFPSGRLDRTDLKPAAAIAAKSAGCRAPVTAMSGVMCVTLFMVATGSSQDEHG